LRLRVATHHFPYTTLFRSLRQECPAQALRGRWSSLQGVRLLHHGLPERELQEGGGFGERRLGERQVEQFQQVERFRSEVQLHERLNEYLRTIEPPPRAAT